MESRKPWQVLAECQVCKDRIYSKYNGQFVSCKCGASFVDQTPHYGRYGGSIQEVDKKLDKKLEAEVKKLNELLDEQMDGDEIIGHRD